MRLLITVMFLGATLVCVAQQPAEQPASTADVMRMMEVLRVKEQSARMHRMMIEQVKAMVAQTPGLDKDMTPEQQQEFQRLMQDMMQEMLAAYPVEQMMLDTVPIYAKHFSKNEIDGLIRFHESPLGRKMLDKTPVLMQEVLAVMLPKMQKAMADLQPKMMERIQAIVRMKHEGPSPTPAPAAQPAKPPK